MNDDSKNGLAQITPGNNHTIDIDELGELRTLLLGVQPNDLTKLYERLNNPDIAAEDISRLLPEAVILRSLKDKQLGEAIVPTVEQAIDSSVKKDLNILSDAIFPIIGPASRKAIAVALEEMVQSLNQTLEHSLSPQSFKWRLEARQTGKSFAEVVLLRTLVYRVEQVFLIHKHTGLLLQHILASHVTAQDPDLVSAMLTAIQDFVKDSFHIQKQEVLQSLQFGELTIWVEEGPSAIIASIIRGNAPQELRLIFQDAIEKIHLKLGRELDIFQGETDPFVKSQPYLENCLQARYEIPEKKNYTYAYALIGILAIALGTWSFFSIRERIRWSSYLDKLNQEPGIVVVKTERRNGKRFISGMRDPLATDPNLVMQQTDINPQTVMTHWEPYLSLNPEFTVKRAVNILQPPKSVLLKVDENGVLQISGTAPRKWIQQTQGLWRFVPGVTQYQDKNLVDANFDQLQIYKKQIEEEMLLFSEGTTELLPGEKNKLQNLIRQIKQLQEIATYLGVDVSMQINGHTNTIGSEQQNMILSKKRADVISAYVKSQGIKLNNISIAALGSNELFRGKDKKFNRRVTFKVLLGTKK